MKQGRNACSLYSFAFAMTFQCFLLFVYANDLRRSILTQLFALYFLGASYIIFRDLINAKKVGKEILAGVFSGFIILGIIGGFVFTSRNLSTQFFFEYWDGRNQISKPELL